MTKKIGARKAPFFDVNWLSWQCPLMNKLENAWQSLVYSPLGAVVLPLSEYL